MTSRRLTPEERRIWALVAKTVTPRPGKRHPTADPAPKSTKTASKPATKRVLARTLSPPPPAKPPGPAEMSGDKRVRRGRLDISAKLDLHGLRSDEARTVLMSFLARARADGARSVLVVTGKGDPARKSYQHEAPGVLRRLFPKWLAAPDLRAHVSGYAQAHQRHGGAGAWYVFLRRPSEDEPLFR